jgi:hypothetical protein
MPVTPVGELHSTEHECTVQLQHAYFLKFARYAATSFLSPQKKRKRGKKILARKKRAAPQAEKAQSHKTATAWGSGARTGRGAWDWEREEELTGERAPARVA